MPPSFPPSYISQLGSHEKYLRKRHIHGLKVWWARRPLRAMRALLIAEIQAVNGLQKSVSPSLLEALNPDTESYQSFADSYDTGKISVLDPFSGGGSIPWEAAQLGCETTALEINPIAHYLQDTLYEAARLPGFSDALQKVGEELLDQLEPRLAFLYPGETVPAFIFWGRTAPCLRCGEVFSLSRLSYLARRPRKVRWLDRQGGALSLKEEKAPPVKTGFVCPSCQQVHSYADLKTIAQAQQLHAAPLAWAEVGHSGKQYQVISETEQKAFAALEPFIEQELNRLVALLPQAPVRALSGVINPSLYDLRTMGDFLHPRQRLMLAYLLEEMISAWPQWVQTYGETQARLLQGALTGLIEWQVDWNSQSNMWIPQNEQVGRSLAGPGVAMRWDFVELDPCAKNSSSMRTKLKRMVDTYRHISLGQKLRLELGSATHLPLPDQSQDIVMTDPPYFDSVDYGALSAFFQPWIEVLLQKTGKPEADLSLQQGQELIVKLGRGKKSQVGSGVFYQRMMTQALAEMKRVLKPTGRGTLIYAHKTLEGWAALADAFKAAGCSIHSCLPLQMERKARPRAMKSHALHGVVAMRFLSAPQVKPSLEEDLLQWQAWLEKGEVHPSLLVIYLAALACKLYVDQSFSDFKAAHQAVCQQWESLNQTAAPATDWDHLTQAYVEGRRGQVEKLDASQADLLRAHGLLSSDQLLALDEIATAHLPARCLLKRAAEVLQALGRQQVPQLEAEEVSSMRDFYYALDVPELNSLQHRSGKRELQLRRRMLSRLP
ncbi:MAG: DUF1156 domain-containing protein [Bacteroidota bacterium]